MLGKPCFALAPKNRLDALDEQGVGVRMATVIRDPGLLESMFTFEAIPG